MEKTLYLNPFLRCPCGKIHVRAGITIGSVCTCGQRLDAIQFVG